LQRDDNCVFAGRALAMKAMVGFKQLTSHKDAKALRITMENQFAHSGIVILNEIAVLVKTRLALASLCVFV